MNFKIRATGHSNISSKHKSTFEITKDSFLTPSGDCVIGIAMNHTMKDLSSEIKSKIADENTKIKIKLKTSNNHDEIIGYGHPDLTLDHPTDIVCRKSQYICSRTLMIKSNKASSDLNPKLIDDLKNGSSLDFEIIID